jgi:hypothetical protein
MGRTGLSRPAGCWGSPRSGRFWTGGWSPPAESGSCQGWWLRPGGRRSHRAGGGMRRGWPLLLTMASGGLLLVSSGADPPSIARLLLPHDDPVQLDRVETGVGILRALLLVDASVLLMLAWRLRRPWHRPPAGDQCDGLSRDGGLGGVGGGRAAVGGRGCPTGRDRRGISGWTRCSRWWTMSNPDWALSSEISRTTISMCCTRCWPCRITMSGSRRTLVATRCCSSRRCWRPTSICGPATPGRVVSGWPMR